MLGPLPGPPAPPAPPVDEPLDRSTPSGLETDEVGRAKADRVRRRRVAVQLTRWEQVLMVARGNPKGFTTLGDLAERGALFINRQRGSGTRQLLDYRLQQEGIVPEAIQGYHRELYTHLAVAAAVKTGGADV